MSRSRPVPAGIGAGDHPHGDALALRLPVLRGTLERQLRFRREQVADLDADVRWRATADRVTRDGAKRDLPPALREVDALVAAGARRAIADIELALLRMRTGRYGRCRSCGAPIPLPVLEAVPKTTRCLPCQQRDDRAEERVPLRRSGPRGSRGVGLAPPRRW